MNYRELARLVGAQGRYGDTELVHVTKREKELLRRSGGSGTENPITGLDEYFDVGADNQAVGFGDAGDSMGFGGHAAAGGASVAPDIGPAVEVGTHPLDTAIDVAPAVDVSAAPQPGFFGNLAKTGPSISRDGLAALPAMATMALVPGGGLMRGVAALGTTIADALGISHEDPTGLFPGPADSTGFGGDLYYSQPEMTAAFASPPISTPTSSAFTPLQNKGLEPYIRDLLRRQGIFV